MLSHSGSSAPDVHLPAEFGLDEAAADPGSKSAAGTEVVSLDVDAEIVAVAETAVAESIAVAYTDSALLPLRWLVHVGVQVPPTRIADPTTTSPLPSEHPHCLADRQCLE